MILPDSPEWREYVDQAVRARMDLLPTQAKPRDPMTHEPHPVTDGMEEDE